ncbi:IPExxxVDY family protein [Pontibacter sp. KCTC 32443]|uniref:IPExxxVDY family protein n=1 Tax=Pontibacter TaxID=323449 RepID=UPI00164E506D|nr:MULTISPECIES: IPExxxVDY family protein [Pontibacter]MBC5775231.1 IPExxxVDY family protein [Pontibacter sp. KCTC 32443]
MKTFYLDTDYAYDFDLYGLVSPDKEYKVAWWLNKLFSMHLTKQKDLCYTLPGREQLLVSNYEFSTDHSIIRLFRNRGVGTSTIRKPFLLPDIKEYDYVLQIAGSTSKLSAQNFINTLLRIPLVQYVKKFDPQLLKFKENLIF